MTFALRWYSMHSRAVFIIVVRVLISSTLGINETFFRKHPTPYRLCSGSGLTNFGTARSNLGCGKMCGHVSGCLSYFYNRLDQSCRGSNLVYKDLTACDSIPGIVLYEQDVRIGDPCLSDSNCPLPDTFCNVDQCSCPTHMVASADLRVCLAVCGDAPPIVTNGAVTQGNIIEDTVRNYTCDAGYGVPPGVSATTTCLADATWSPLEFTCILKKCETGWHQIGDHCYFAEQPFPNMQIDMAMSYCYDKSAYVLQLETPNENTAVIDYLSTTFGINQWWIGLTDEGNEGTWRWMETNELASWLNWNVVEPDGAEVENYVIIWETNMWADVPLPDNNYTPVCEKETEVIL